MSGLVSVIIPCYNYAAYLEPAVRSVCAQTYRNLECLIIDDGSTDNTRAVALTLCAEDERVRYHFKENGGLSSARNFGLERAAGSYICFLDADDLFDSKKLEAQVACMQQDPATDIVYGGARFFQTAEPRRLYLDKARSTGPAPNGFSGQGKELVWRLLKGNLMVVSAPMLRSEVFRKVSGFDVRYRSYEDWHFWLRAAFAGCRFTYCDQPPVCTYIRFGHESMMSDKGKLLRAGIQLRKDIMNSLDMRMRMYNLYRMVRSKLKLRLS